jgi:hypothetical protein
MRASFETSQDGAIALHLDIEAARAVFASVLFASQFHENIAPLAEVAERGLAVHSASTADGKEPLCQ